MEFLQKIRDFIYDLEEKDFYKYLGIVVAILVLLVSFMMYRYYSKVTEYSQMIEEANDIRQGQVKVVLARLEKIKKQKEEADAILQKEEDFKILDYYTKLLQELRLSQYDKSTDVVQKDRGQKYRESELTAKLGGLDMKQLCELLEKLELKKRIKIRNLEIRRSKKRPRSIDVDLIISTLLPKVQEAT